MPRYNPLDPFRLPSAKQPRNPFEEKIAALKTRLIDKIERTSKLFHGDRPYGTIKLSKAEQLALYQNPQWRAVLSQGRSPEELAAWDGEMQRIGKLLQHSQE